MSYEGREQIICKQGHYYVVVSCQYGGTLPKCPTCGSKQAWVNSIDDTNCDAIGEIPQSYLDQWIVTPGIPCIACEHPHLAFPPKYRVPSKKETAAARHYYDGECWRPYTS